MFYEVIGIPDSTESAKTIDDLAVRLCKTFDPDKAPQNVGPHLGSKLFDTQIIKLLNFFYTECKETLPDRNIFVHILLWWLKIELKAS